MTLSLFNQNTAPEAGKKPGMTVYAEANCFNAMAEGILDYCLCNPGKTANVLLAKLIAPFYACYPGSKPTFMNSSSLNTEDRFQFLRNTYGMRNLVKGFGFVLRELVIKELAENPDKYAGMYKKDISLEAIRQQDKILDVKTAQIAITALARVLHINMQIMESET